MFRSDARCAGTMVKSLSVPASWTKLSTWLSRLGMPAGSYKPECFLTVPNAMSECIWLNWN
eukprot:3879206-Amphidinium_carterae.1